MTHFQVGEPMTQEDLLDLPVGTTIASNTSNAYTYLLGEGGIWTEVRNPNRQHTYTAFGNGYVVRSYPDGFTPEPMTTTEYKWRFRNHTLSAAHSHSVRLEAVVHALNEMGAGMDALPLREGLVLRNGEDVAALPEGSLVQCGSPQVYDSFGLFAVNRDGTHYVMGAQRSLHQGGAVIAELPPSYVPPEVDEGEAAMNDFKVKAYVIGLKLKQAQDWCSTYENIVAPLGITAQAIRPLVQHSDLTGTKVSPEGAAELPVGTILSWQNEAHTACSWFVRVDHAGNRAGTRRIFTHANEGVTGRTGHFSNSMTVVWVPPSGREVVETAVLREMTGLDVVAHWQYLPPGTVISWRASQFYMMMRDHRATQFGWHPGRGYPVRDRGDYGADSFGSPEDLRVVEFPAVEVASSVEPF